MFNSTEHVIRPNFESVSIKKKVIDQKVEILSMAGCISRVRRNTALLAAKIGKNGSQISLFLSFLFLGSIRKIGIDL